MKRLVPIFVATLVVGAFAQSIEPEYKKWDREQLEAEYVAKLEQCAKLRRELAAAKKKIAAFEKAAAEADPTSGDEAKKPPVKPRTMQQILREYPGKWKNTIADGAKFEAWLKENVVGTPMTVKGKVYEAFARDGKFGVMFNVPQGEITWYCPMPNAPSLKEDDNAVLTGVVQSVTRMGDSGRVRFVLVSE